MGQLTIVGDDFILDGRPIRLLSGAMHYFRVLPAYWRDRLLKLRACGLNTVETYVPWNLHEPRPGQWQFTGHLDIVRYVELAAEVGLHVIVRPGPYICSEWDLGGLPSWLLADPAMQLRCCYPPYLQAVERYLDALLPRLLPLQASQGGPIVAMQVENEYGSYGNDHAYLRHLEAGLRARGVDGLLFTSDGALDWMLEGGTLPHILKVVNFGSAPLKAFAKLREHQPQGPLMCGEFWNGWFDHWGEPHHRRDPQEVAATLDALLGSGASVNLYMFHGGTSRGFMAGANHNGSQYQPDVSSYDDDALLDEAGDPTPKYWACRAVLGKYAPLPDLPLPAPSPKVALGRVPLTEQASLWAALPAPSQGVPRTTPEPMEMLGQAYGLILYRTQVHGPREECPLILQEAHDRAQVFVDGEYRGLIERDHPQSAFTLGFGPGDHQLDILVENMGRINYGPLLHDRKGITQGVRLGNQFLYHWTIYPLPLDDISRLTYQPQSSREGPAFFRGALTVEQPADTFLALPGWGKGVCFLNGYNLGRYWERGPQHTLYVPAALLRRGANELVVFELHGMAEPTVEFRDVPDLG